MNSPARIRTARTATAVRAAARPAVAVAAARYRRGGGRDLIPVPRRVFRNTEAAPESHSGAASLFPGALHMPPAPLSRSGKSRRTTDSPISYFIKKALETPGLVSFAAGLVDEESLPVAEVAAAAADVLGDPRSGRAALQYGSDAGAARAAPAGARPRVRRRRRRALPNSTSRRPTCA
jgi:DNA-binding transcriptional MocR family regulator